MSYIAAGLIGFLFIQGILLFLLFIRRQPRLPNVLISLLIVKYALLMLNLLFEASDIYLDLPTFPFLSGPLVFLYVRTSRDRNSLKMWELLFFLPAVLFYPIGMILPSLVFLLADVLWNLLFALAAFSKGIHWRKETKRELSESPGIWFLLIPLLVSVSSLLSGLDLFYFFMGQMLLSDFFSLLMSFAEASFIFIPAWFVLYREGSAASGLFFEKGNGRNSVKYEKNLLDENLVDLYYKTLTTRMKDERLYEQSGLTIGQLAERLGIPAAHLSQVINRKEGLNYYQYINRVRIRKVCQMLEQSGDKNILEIMYDAGFNSKSTFNNAFRTQMGQTPGEYRKKIRKGN